MVALAAAPLAAQPALAQGTIKGSVRFAGGAVDDRKVAITIDQYICGKEKDSERLVVSADRGIANAVVYLQTAPTTPKPATPPPPVHVDQKQCAFVPRVVVVPAGGTVEFLNSDRLLHNLHSRSKDNESFNKTQPKGRVIPIVFGRPEIVRIDCDLHSWMRAWVVVAAHPFHALTNERGAFTLTGIPAGTYTLEVWQEALGVESRSVTVTDGGTASVVIEMRAK
jgi:plastocyanin